MRPITVYRVDYGRKRQHPVGVVLEQRKMERGENYKDLLRLARKTFASDRADGVHIVIDASQARWPYLPEQTMDCWAG